MSVDRRFSGRGDVPLTDLGQEQARRAGERLVGEEIAAVVSSPLIRARQTAEAVGSRLNLPVTVDDGWLELDFGSWEGLTYGEVRDRDPDGLRTWLDVGAPGPAPHGGETFAQVADRVGQASDALVAAYAGKTVLVVSHVTPIKTVAGRVLGDARAALSALHLDLCSLSEAALFADGRGSVRGWNESSYLR
jgi:broad specificity phosphatase PhoE